MRTNGRMPIDAAIAPSIAHPQAILPTPRPSSVLRDSAFTPRGDGYLGPPATVSTQSSDVYHHRV